MSRFKVILTLAYVAAVSLAVLLVAAWVVGVNATSAAYRVHHRARFEYRAGLASLRDVCETSRRCCDAECTVPFADPAVACRRHLDRLTSLEKSVGMAGTGAAPIASTRDAELLRGYLSEARLWARQGRFDLPLVNTLNFARFRVF